MKQKWISLMALILCAALLLPLVAMAREVSPEDFLEMTPDAQEQYMKDNGLSYAEAAGWSGDGGASLLDGGYVQCASCGGWYKNGNEYRNHFCTGNPANPSSSWTSKDEYYDALVQGQLNAETTMAIGNLYVNTANGKSLNMRSRPNTDGQVITTIPNGAAVTLFWYENSSWAFVAYRSYFGFCMTRHLSESVPAATKPAAQKPSTGNATVATGTDASLNQLFQGFNYVNYTVSVKPSNPSGFVNVRWAPSKNAPVQCIYYANTILKVLATNGIWSQVYNEQTGQSGFMMNEFLNKYLH